MNTPKLSDYSIAMLNTPSLLRRSELEALARIRLNGNVLDLGGVRGSAYINSLKGDFVVTILNMDKGANPDISHNLELPLPVGDGAYDHVLLINVLEHIFEYRSLLKEMARVVSKNGSAVIIVPFIFPFHPSPEDYHRFTRSALHLELVQAGFTDVQISPMGTGVFSSLYLFVDRLLPRYIRFFNYYTFRYAVLALDSFLSAAARALGKKYSPSDYAFGFCVVASKR